METLYLTRRNILTLLSKLDRKRNGEDSYCSIIKNDNQHSIYPQTMQSCLVTAIEDEDYYTDRDAGEVLDKDHDSL